VLYEERGGKERCKTQPRSSSEVKQLGRTYMYRREDVKSPGRKSSTRFYIESYASDPVHSGLCATTLALPVW